MPRLKKKWMLSPPPAPPPALLRSETPAHPNVVQAARHFGTSPSAFRRLAIREGFKKVRIGNKDTFDLKELDGWWEKAAKKAA